MQNMNLAPHEAIEIREFLTQEMLEIKKVTANMELVSTTELKNYMQDSINCKKTALKNIQTALEAQNKQKGV